MSLDEAQFDPIAADELKHLEKALGDLDPDECEAEFSLDVLTLTLHGKEKVVINSHRAARQIWMAGRLAGARRAWHFTPTPDGAGWRWVTDKGDELHATLRAVLKDHLGRDVSL